MKGKSRKYTCGPPYVGHHTLRALETAEQKEARLAKRRLRDRARRASQSTVQRERTVQQRSEWLIHETPENRQSRLLRMRQRTVSETSEEREAYLQQLSLNRQRRLAIESQEERERPAFSSSA